MEASVIEPLDEYTKRLTAGLIGRRVSVYSEHTVATGMLELETDRGIFLSDVLFSMRSFYQPNSMRGAEWRQPWAIIPWSTIHYIGEGEAP